MAAIEFTFGGGRNRLASLFAVAAFLTACEQPADSNRVEQTPLAPAEYDLAVVNVHVIDTLSGALRQNRTLFIDGDTIAAVAPSSDDAENRAARVIDGAGAYALPGLWDMHVHFRNGYAGTPDLANENAVFLRQYLGYGVTGVRDAAGDLPDAVREWRASVANGDMLGPRIFTSLQKIDGEDPAWPGSIPVTDDASAAAAMDALLADGADYIKVYSRITPEGYLAALRAAEARDAKTAAHMLFSVSFEDTIAAGLDSIEHTMYLLKAASPEDAEISDALRRGEFEGSAFARLADSFDETTARAVLTDAAERGVAVTPTLYIAYLLGYLDQDDHQSDERLNAVPARLRATYADRVARAARRDPDDIAFDHEMAAMESALARLAHESGMMLLAGSDSGASNSYAYPGDSLHQELRMMAEAGIPRIDVLRAATINGARWLGVADRYGEIAEGRAADILLLDANPLEDIENTRAIRLVIKNGELLDAEDLADLRALCHNQDPPIADCN